MTEHKRSYADVVNTRQEKTLPPLPNIYRQLERNGEYEACNKIRGLLGYSLLILPDKQPPLWSDPDYAKYVGVLKYLKEKGLDRCKHCGHLIDADLPFYE